jgi:hypothetical protein
LNNNNKIRLIELKKTLKKTRYNVDPDSNTIIDATGNSIYITAADSSIKIVPPPRLIPVDSLAKINEVNKTRGTSRPSVIEILKYNPQEDFYKVKLDLPDENNS